MSCAGSQRLLAAYSFCCCESLFFVRVSSFSLPRPISKNAVSYFLRQVIFEAGAIRADVAAPLRAHSVRGVATSVSFMQNWSPRCWRPQLGDRTQC